MPQKAESISEYTNRVYFILDCEYEETLHLFNKCAGIGDIQYISFGSKNTFIPETIMLPSYKEHFKNIKNIIATGYSLKYNASNTAGLVCEFIQGLNKGVNNDNCCGK